MLDHPTIGVHYTCHTKGLKDGSCRNKTSKSGAPVRICGCEATDFCNYSYWPDKWVRLPSCPIRYRSARSVSAQRSQEITIPVNVNWSPLFFSSVIISVLFCALRWRYFFCKPNQGPTFPHLWPSAHCLSKSFTDFSVQFGHCRACTLIIDE